MKWLFHTIISTQQELLLRPNICWEIMSHTQIVQAVLKVWFQDNIGLLLSDFEIY